MKKVALFQPSFAVKNGVNDILDDVKSEASGERRPPPLKLLITPQTRRLPQITPDLEVREE